MFVPLLHAVNQSSADSHLVNVDLKTADATATTLQSCGRQIVVLVGLAKVCTVPKFLYLAAIP